MTRPTSQGHRQKPDLMQTRIRTRVAPIIALLVICSGFLLFVLVMAYDAPITPDAIPTIDPGAITFTLNAEIQYHSQKGDLQAALFYVETQANQDGWTAALHEEAGNLWRDMGDLSRAVPHWEVAAELDPQPQNLRRLAQLYIEAGNWGKAYQHIDHLLQLVPDDAWALYYGGVLLAPSDRLTARQYLTQAATSDVYQTDASRLLYALEDEATGTLRVGAVLAGMREWSLAENAFQQAAAVYYPFPEATAYVGLMRVQQQFDGSAWIEQALALDSNNADVRLIEGLYWRVLGDYDASIDALLTAIILDPTVPEYYAELGNTYRIAGNLGEAEYWLLTALNISDNNPLIQDALNRLREEETAILNVSDLNITRMARAEENDPAVISANGWVLHILGQSDAGLEFVDRALAIDPENSRALYDKARILIEIGRGDEAIPLLETLVAGDSPFVITAQRLLDGLN